MKRYLNMMLVLLVAAGCQDGGDAFEYDSRERTVFLAVVENGPVWTDGDMIGVYGSESGANERYVVRRAAVGSTGVAEIYGPVVTGDEFMAYYPYNPDYSGGAVGSMPMELSGSQKWNADVMAQFEECCPMAAGSLGQDGIFHLYRPLGILGFKLDFDEPECISRVVLESRSMPLAGMVSVGNDGNVDASFASSRTLELVCPENGVMTRIGIETTSFCFVLPPAVYPPLELVVRFRTVAGDEIVLPVSEEVTVRRMSLSDFLIGTVVFGGMTLPGFEEENGGIVINSL